MHVDHTPLSGVVVISPARFGDARGWFSETWNADRMQAAGLDIGWVQDNHSFSAQVGTLRGLHFQSPPRAQDKLVRCTRGAIFDVAVDIRKGSPTYGKWFGIELTADNGKQLLVPKGFLHGFATRTPDVEVQYKCSDVYAPDCDGSVLWSSVGIDWGVTGDPVLSAKDQMAMPFDRFESPFTYPVR